MGAIFSPRKALWVLVHFEFVEVIVVETLSVLQGSDEKLIEVRACQQFLQLDSAAKQYWNFVSMLEIGRVQILRREMFNNPNSPRDIFLAWYIKSHYWLLVTSALYTCKLCSYGINSSLKMQYNRITNTCVSRGIDEEEMHFCPKQNSFLMEK